MSKRGSGWYWTALAGLVTLLFVYAERRDLTGLYLDYQGSEQEVRMLEMELDQRTAEEAGLRRNVEQLDHDPLEVEAAIRRSKMLVREGETIYRVPLSIDTPSR